ncbi:MAG: 4-(cytidine 5'-diphospho)-2-C-methyl-D-erythritol kinase [Erysipelothrix sp.]|nr:4-(cytidine 5'-diphospho)-2-C-methyl-D-erythritol kinase [Erysipelothrix sp.]
MKRKAHAKLNLGLNVIRKREDGYHDLRMIMVPVDLFDTVEIVESNQLTIQSNKYYLPNDDKNTVYKAVKVMHQRYDTPTNFQIKLVKNIPTQAGMAGGSADAACVINMLNDMYSLNLTQDELIEVGLKIGADVPFCLFNKPALVTGIGEKLEFLNIDTNFHLFLVKPSFGVSTKKLFENLEIKEASVLEFEELLDGLQTGNYDKIQRNIINDLQPQAINEHPEIQKIIDELVQFGFDNACMTGAGSVVFGITQDENLTRKAVEQFYLKYPLVKKSGIVTI